MLKYLTYFFTRTLMMGFFGKILRGLIIFFTNYIFKQKLNINNDNIQNGVIISLTSFPVRIGRVNKVVISLLSQTMLPEKIFLILSEKQFPNKYDDLPQKLLNLRNNIFEIIFEKDDVRSHKKYHYAMTNFPEKIIITVDDDLFYPENLVSELYSYHQKFPNEIICNRANKIIFDKENNILNYKDWLPVKEFSVSKLNLLTGCSGVLYPPNFSSDLLLDKKKFMELTPLADDLWLFSNAVFKGIKICCTAKFPILIPVINKNNITLNSMNVDNNMNDSQMKNLIKDFGNFIIDEE